MLQVAICFYNANIVRFLCKNGANVHIDGKTLGTALQVVAERRTAISASSVELHRFFWGFGAKINCYDSASDGDTGSTLHLAVEAADIQLVYFLLGDGADVHKRGPVLMNTLICYV